MKEILQFYANKLSAGSLSLKKKTLLVDKPWAYIDENGVLMKIIFRSNHTVIIAQNGKVTEGEWEYLGGTRNLLFNNGQEKFLLKEAFLDPNVLVMKTDSSKLDYIALANEEVIPDYNIAAYLHTVYAKKLQLRTLKANNGYILDVHHCTRDVSVSGMVGLPVDISSEDIFLPKICGDGKRFELEVDDVRICIYVKGGKIDSMYRLQRILDIQGNMYDIEIPYDYQYIECGYTVRNSHSELAGSLDILTEKKDIYRIYDGKIIGIGVLKTHKLKEGYVIQVEYITTPGNKDGFLIKSVEPDGIIPNGIYRAKYHLKKFYIINGKRVRRKTYKKYM